MNTLLKFYSGDAPDSHGRYVHEILAHDDQWLEETHDYIQWLFPNKEKSNVTPDAPIIDQEVIENFNSDEKLQNQLRLSFKRMLTFYGLKLSEKKIIKADNWDERKINWFTKDSHNSLRITRILKCLMTLGMQEEALMFYETLISLVKNDPQCRINQVTTLYWSDAVLKKQSPAGRCFR